jgi:small ligand-binding sensory domain FIST
MPFAAALSIHPQATAALAEVCAETAALGPADLALIFFSAHHATAARALGAEAFRRLNPRCLLGCVGETIIGNDREVEEGPALALWLGRWPHPVQLEPFHLVLERTSEGPSLLGWPDGLVGANAAQTSVLLLGDPYTFPIDFFLSQVNEDRPAVPILGGMASGIHGPGECRLLYGSEIRDQGAVGVVLQGDLGLRSIVSQGCRPIGRPLVITRAEENVIFELGGRPPLDQLRELWQTLTPQEQFLIRQQGLHVGRVINEYQDVFHRGDFLVRNVMRLDAESMAITEQVRVGQTVQFHIRDAESADEDLTALLRDQLAGVSPSPAAALLFSCNGRGRRLFPKADHDARAVRAQAGPIPLAGFFAQGELGPVGGQNFMHGFTASVALFTETPLKKDEG